MTKAEQRRQWREQEAKDIEASKQRLSEETGVPRSHPKFDKAYDIAYTAGHGSGLSEVECYFVELAELLKP